MRFRPQPRWAAASVIATGCAVGALTLGVFATDARSAAARLARLPPALVLASVPPSSSAFVLDDDEPTREPADEALRDGPCPVGMASIDDAYCVDRYEASLVEVLPGGDEAPWAPYASVEGREVRAVSEAGVVPQGYISGLQAERACAASGKRLCKPQEWKRACMGPAKTTYGYGSEREPRRCNDHGRGPVTTLLGPGGAEAATRQGELWTWDNMNRPELNQLEGTVAPTGSHPGCTNDYGVYDMVGNLHEWVADPAGTFQGGYYQDTHLNGDGCQYRTTAHEAWYHDYSTGFRCCADVEP